MNQSVTDGMAGKYETEGAKYGGVKGIHALVVQARTNAQIRINARDSLVNKMGEFVRLGKLDHVLSFGVRGIIGLDDVFKRSLFRARLTADSYRRALLEFPEGGPKMEKRAQELYETAWVEQNGLPVLADNHDFTDEVNNVRTELLFASNADNVEDIATSAVDELVKPLNKIKSSDNIFGVIFDAFMPYFGVATRGVYRTGRLQFFPLLAARATFANPYTAKIKKLESEIKAEQDIISDPNVRDQLKEGSAEEIKTMLNRIEVLKVRRLKYNEEMLTDTVVGASVAAMGMIGGGLSGNVTGSMSYLSPEERKRARQYGIQPYRAFGMDYRAALPVTFGFSMYADIGTFLYLRRLQDETGQPILDPNLNVFEVMRRSTVEAVKELPLTGGINTFEEIISQDPEKAARAVEKILFSYISVPAQVRKTVKKIMVDNRVVDLKGGDFYDRLAYQVFGAGPMNYETDHFGEDQQTDINWVTETIWRQAPRFKQKGIEFENQNILTFEDILLSDTQSIIGDKPTHLSTGVKMQDFRDEDGVTLKYYYAKTLRTYKQQYRGGKRTLNEAVDRLINDSRWQKKYMDGYTPDETDPEKFTNEALEELNELMRDYYTGARQAILKDKFALNSFINKDNQTLSDYMNVTLDNINSNIRQKPFTLNDLFQ
jgi:hypothetical protein